MFYVREWYVDRPFSYTLKGPKENGPLFMGHYQGAKTPSSFHSWFNGVLI
jgi:hypothetical protein